MQCHFELPLTAFGPVRELRRRRVRGRHHWPPAGRRRTVAAK
jgi:hypothetical protein